MESIPAPSASSPSMSLRDWSLLILLGILWGGSFYFAKVAVDEIPPLLLVFLRVSIAGAALLVWAAAMRISFAPLSGRWGEVAILGLVNNVVPFTLFFVGQTQLGAGAAAVLNATAPFWTLLAAHWFTRDDRLSSRKLVGVLLGFSGAAIMIMPGLVAGLGGPAWAKFALVGCAMSYALAFVWTRRFRKVPPAVLATGQLAMSTAIMLPIAFLYPTVSLVASVSQGVLVSVLGLALLATALAYIIYFRLVASAGASNASLVTLVTPVVAILLGTLFLGERLEAFELFGMVAILGGLLIVDGRILRLRRRTR